LFFRIKEVGSSYNYTPQPYVTSLPRFSHQSGQLMWAASCIYHSLCSLNVPAS